MTGSYLFNYELHNNGLTTNWGLFAIHGLDGCSLNHLIIEMIQQELYEENF